MKVSAELDKHSEDSFSETLGLLANSGIGVVHIRTKEIIRASLALRKAILTEGNHYREWSVAYGMAELDASDILDINLQGKGDGVADLTAALGMPGNPEFIKETDKDDSLHFFVYVNPQYWLDGNPMAAHYIMQYTHMLPSTNVRVILLTPDMPLPDSLSDSVVTVRLVPPSHGELREYLDTLLMDVSDSWINIDEEDKDRICYAGAGMSKESFETYVSLAIVDAVTKEEDGVATTEDIIASINKGKTEIVNKNDILELYPTEDMNDVGGMENLKEWVAKRANCYSDEAMDYGIEPPKGMVLVGIPGSGKSLAAKAIANEFGVPLVRLDFGRVFNSLVGKSEERIRTALSMVESMAPVVLFADEIDKGLGGIGGSGDSGTSSRVLGSFLTWLQENKTPVFTMVTANNIDALPPELLRRGRFDGIFATGFPTQAEVREVLAIHLRKRGWDIKDFDKASIQGVLNAARGYVPAEIEAAIKDGLIDAFSAGEDFSMEHVEKALKRMVPLSVTYNEKIQIMTAWMKQNAIPASKSYDDLSDNSKVSALRPRKTRIRKKEEE